MWYTVEQWTVEQTLHWVDIKELTNLLSGRDECPMIIPYMEGPMSARMRSRDLTFQLNAALSSAQHLIEKWELDTRAENGKAVDGRAVDGRRVNVKAGTVEQWTVKRETVKRETVERRRVERWTVEW